MSPGVGNVFFDTCTLANVSTVGRLDVLATRYGHRARWTETVQLEIRRGLSAHNSLLAVLNAGWLGDPIEIDGSMTALREIELIRRGLGGTSTSPLEHLGEAEIIYHLERQEIGAIFATDGRAAHDFARRRGIFVLDTAAVLADCFQQGELGCPAAYQLIVQMADQGRGVRLPSDHRGICP